MASHFANAPPDERTVRDLYEDMDDGNVRFVSEEFLRRRECKSMTVRRIDNGDSGDTFEVRITWSDDQTE